MPSASRPDRPSPDGSSGPDSADGEVVEVFTGDTLEEAMAAAVAALGPGLTVRRARKVRAGVRGLLGRDRYEVLAVPPDGPLPAPPASRLDDGDDAVGSALEALLEAADEREAGGPPPARPIDRPSAPRPLAARPSSSDLPPPLRRSPPATPAPLPPAPRSGGSPLRRVRPVPVEPAFEERPVAAPDPAPPADEDRPRRRGRTPGAALSGRAPHPDPGVADHPAEPAPVRPAERPRAEELPALSSAPEPDVDGDEQPEEPVRSAPAAAKRPAKKAAQGRAKRPRSAGWSRAALAGLGVPDAVLDALPEATPRDDLGWVVALTAAIEATVPPPAEPDERTPVVVSGHGVTGAVAVLDAGCRGLAPGTISHAGRTAPATATELALVLRHHVTGGA